MSMQESDGRVQEEEALHRWNRAQFGEMLTWAARGWRPAAAGFRCGECGGAQWGKVFGKRERFMCVKCGRAREFVIG